MFLFYWNPTRSQNFRMDNKASLKILISVNGLILTLVQQILNLQNAIEHYLWRRLSLMCFLFRVLSSIDSMHRIPFSSWIYKQPGRKSVSRRKLQDYLYVIFVYHSLCMCVCTFIIFSRHLNLPFMFDDSRTSSWRSTCFVTLWLVPVL